MKTRWHHLVTYASSRCLPSSPPQPRSMSTPLSQCLVDFRLSPSLWLTTTIIIVISILPLLASSFTPLLPCVSPPSSPIFHQDRVLFGVVTVTATVTVGTLKDGYVRNVPLPRVPQIQSANPTTSHESIAPKAGIPIPGYLHVPSWIPTLPKLGSILASVILPQPSSISSSNPPLPLTLTKGVLLCGADGVR